MGKENHASLDVSTPPLTPVVNSCFENDGKDETVSSAGRVANLQYTLKPATRAYASTARLNLQHYLWKDQTGFLLHPDIPLDGRTDLKIADVGTGTGIWLLDLARALPPTAQLDGFDIDISDCPPEHWLPRNIKMQYLNALGDIPAHLVGNYDIVHLRLFQVVVKNNDPGPLLRNMLKMLKPGGYLQWAEYDMTTQTSIKASPTLNSSALDAIPAFVQSFQKNDARVGVQNWIPLLPTTFHAHALTNITSSRYPTATPFLPYQLDVFLLTYEELAAKTFDRLGGGAGAGGNGDGGVRGDGDREVRGNRDRELGTHGDHLRNLIEKGSEEARQGVGWGMDRVVVVGRKALIEMRGEGGRVVEVVAGEECVKKAEIALADMSLKEAAPAGLNGFAKGLHERESVCTCRPVEQRHERKSRGFLGKVWRVLGRA